MIHMHPPGWAPGRAARPLVLVGLSLGLSLVLGLGCGGADEKGEGDAAGGADAGQDSGGAEGDAGGADTGPCAEVPLVNYNNFGHSFVLHTCQGCHASTAADRYGAPADSTFDTVEQVWAQRDRVLARAAAEPPTMPPAGGSSEDDRVRLRWWLECAEEGT
jgi:hypothetical protein